MELSPASAELAGWLLTAVYQALAMAALGADALAQGYAFGHMAAAGALVWATSRLWQRLGRESWLARVLLFTVLVAPLLRVTVAPDLQGPVGRLSPLSSAVSYWVLALLFSGVLALARELVWRWLARGTWRVVPLACAAALGVGHGLMSPHTYPGLHLLASGAAALVTGAALYGLPVPVRAWPARRSRRLLLAATVALGALSVLVPAENAARLALQEQPGAVWAPVWTPLWARTQSRTSAAGRRGEWYRSRASAPSVPAHAAVAAREELIVLLLGIDSMRAVILEDESQRKQLPELFRLRDGGAWFRQARSPGASTATAIGPMFAGKPYSALYWTEHSERRPDVFPHRDPTPRFPELLSRASIPTVTVDTSGWLNNRFGLVRGFSKEVDGRRKTKSQGPSSYPSAKRAAGLLAKQLRAHRAGPLFAYVHFMDAHSPYTSAGPAETPYAGYLKELGLVDQELGKLRRLLEERDLARRTLLVVYADHGEAFGEHGLTWHASSLYDPMIRVPLLISGTGLAARVIDEPVSLLDLYPTIVDLYGLDTPGHVLGQSLVPLLTGANEPLSRPIVAEGRLKRTLVDRNLRKAILDPRAGTREVYELGEDPGEERNLCARDCEHDPSSALLMGDLEAYFAAHEHVRPGYQTPFRRW